MSLGNTPPRWGAAQSKAFSGVSASCTAVGLQTYAVRLIATAACHVHVAQPGVAATTSDSYIAGFAIPEVIAVSPGDVISVIQHTGIGTLYLTELTY